MDKYTVKAISTLVGLLAVAVVTSLGTMFVLEYLKPTAEQVVFTVCMAVLAYTAYNLVKIQADIYRSRDRLNK